MEEKGPEMFAVHFLRFAPGSSLFRRPWGTVLYVFPYISCIAGAGNPNNRCLHDATKSDLERHTWLQQFG
jgi:hypothetical protein